MKKKNIREIFSVLIILSFLYACNNEASVQKEIKKFSLKAVLRNSNKETVFLQNLNSKDITTLDSTFINEKGEFAFHTQLSENGFYRILLPEKNFITLLLDTTEQVEITGDLKNFAESYTIKGSEGSILIYQLDKERRNNFKKIDSLGKIFMDAKYKPDFVQIRNQIDSAYKKIFFEYKNFIKNFIDSNLHSLAIYWALSQKLGNQPVLDPDSDFSYYEKVDSVLMINSPKSSYTVSLHNWVTDRKRKMLEQKLDEERLAIGAPAPEIMVNDTEEKPISLSSFKGKFVLIDFWASWCKPCRQENPRLVKLYNKYKNKGFEIFSVSFDESDVQWLNAIKSDNMTWKHGFGNENIAKLYNVKTIPMCFLINQEGKIIAKDLRGEELEEKLKEIFRF